MAIGTHGGCRWLWAITVVVDGYGQSRWLHMAMGNHGGCRWLWALMVVVDGYRHSWWL